MVWWAPPLPSLCQCSRILSPNHSSMLFYASKFSIDLCGLLNYKESWNVNVDSLGCTPFSCLKIQTHCNNWILKLTQVFRAQSQSPYAWKEECSALLWVSVSTGNNSPSPLCDRIYRLLRRAKRNNARHRKQERDIVSVLKILQVREGADQENFSHITQWRVLCFM